MSQLTNYDYISVINTLGRSSVLSHAIENTANQKARKPRELWGMQQLVFANISRRSLRPLIFPLKAKQAVCDDCATGNFFFFTERL